MTLAEIELKWPPALLKNNAYINGDTKRGHTKQCKKAMWDIKMILRPAIGYGWVWNGERLQVTITAYRPTAQSDAQNFVDAVCDAIELAIGVNDREYDVSAIGRLDKADPRIQITISQQEDSE